MLTSRSGSPPASTTAQFVLKNLLELRGPPLPPPDCLLPDLDCLLDNRLLFLLVVGDVCDKGERAESAASSPVSVDNLCGYFSAALSSISKSADVDRIPVMNGCVKSLTVSSRTLELSRAPGNTNAVSTRPRLSRDCVGKLRCPRSLGCCPSSWRQLPFSITAFLATSDDRRAEPIFKRRRSKFMRSSFRLAGDALAAAAHCFLMEWASL
mmetsp:Transcript_33845/g.66592  ORF Transcript_33845/g.66592 Transcript_33845/m.66592 type:complete len:210 (+) Transcript_33845:978-1607(+)